MGVESMINSFDEVDKTFVDTGINVIGTKATIKYSIIEDKLRDVERMLEECRRKPIQSDTVDRLTLMELVFSARLEGIPASIEGAISNNYSVANTAVANLERARLHLLRTRPIREEHLTRVYKFLQTGNYDSQYGDYECYGVRPTTTPYLLSSAMRDVLDYSTGNDILDAIIKSFYILYATPYSEHNGLIARLLCHELIGFEGLPLSKVVFDRHNEYIKAMYDALTMKDGTLDISSYIDFMFTCIKTACRIYLLYEDQLNDTEYKLLRYASSEHINYLKDFMQYIDKDEDDTKSVLFRLQDMCYIKLLPGSWNFIVSKDRIQ
jgi:hypothetical protein